MNVKKERVDVLLVEQGLIETREKAKRAIMAGMIYANEVRIDKAGEKIASDVELQIKGQLMPYVSRGGYKLEKALNEFDLTVQDKIMIDIGSSTGGFTDCALQNGAKMSYAIDVGYNQLAWKIRSDERVVVMERTNFRYVTKEDLNAGLPSFASIDVSFISLRLILPVLKTLLAVDSDVVALIKPQFEAGREQVGKKGIVREKKVHCEVLDRILNFAMSEGYDVKDVTYSPITGGDGNIEFLAHFNWIGNKEIGDYLPTYSTENIVNEAHEQLNKKHIKE